MMTSFCEVLVLAEKGGLDQARHLDVLAERAPVNPGSVGKGC